MKHVFGFPPRADYRFLPSAPTPSLRELSDGLLERINASLPEGGRIAQQHLNRVGLAIEAWLEERRIR